jgi:hypothetical protein
MGFFERDKCIPILLKLSLALNLEKPLKSLYGTEWRERGYGFRTMEAGLPAAPVVPGKHCN